MHDEPIMDVAHLGHLEMLTPKPEESLRFFVDVHGHDRERPARRLGLPARLGRLRALLPASSPPRTPRASATRPSARAARRRSSGGCRRWRNPASPIGWHEGELGHGPAFRFHDPDGHVIELYYETEWYEAPPELRPPSRTRRSDYPARGVQCPPAGPLQLPGRRHQGEPRVLRELSGLPPHRTHRAE